jgi:hypothetical protein
MMIARFLDWLFPTQGAQAPNRSRSRARPASQEPVLLIVFILIGLALPAPIQAADIQYHAVVSMSGYIELGDADRLDQLLKLLPNKNDTKVLLSGHGGDALEAIKIGEVIRRAKASTRVVDVCLSGCAYAWLAGVERYASKTAKIGFHRPHLSGDNDWSRPSYSKWELDQLLSVYVRFGFYLTRLGISDDAAAWMLSNELVHPTTTFPLVYAEEYGYDLHWLTPEMSKTLSIPVTWE